MEADPATILVVEDHEPTREFLVANLAADGFSLLEADSLAQAQARVETAYPDLAIVDLGLPDGDGLTLLGRVREADRSAGRVDPDLPVLVLTGRTTELDRLRGFTRGADDYLDKVMASNPRSGVLRIAHGSSGSRERASGRTLGTIT
jgi:DNA-binding response OmpR family regulator